MNQAALDRFQAQLIRQFDQAGVTAGRSFATAFTRAADRASVNLRPMLQRTNQEAATMGRRAGEAIGGGINEGARAGMARTETAMTAFSNGIITQAGATGRRAGAALSSEMTAAQLAASRGSLGLVAASGRQAGNAYGRSWYAAMQTWVAAAHKSTVKNMRKFEDAMVLAGGRIQTTGQLLTQNLTVPIVGLGVAVSAMGIKYADSMNTSQKRMMAMGSSAKESAAALEELGRYAALTPYNFDGMSLAVTRLQSVGLTAGKATKEIEAFADMAAARGVMDTLTFNRALKGFTDVMASGTVHTQDLNQLANAGIPIYNDLAQALYGSRDAVGKVKDDLKKGSISSQKFIEGMSKQWGKYKGSGEDAATSITGSFQNMFEQISMKSSELFGRYATGADIAKAQKGELPGMPKEKQKELKEGDFIYTQFGYTLQNFTQQIGNVATKAIPLLGDALGKVLPVMSKIISGFEKFIDWYNADNGWGWLKTIVKYAALAGPALIIFAGGIRLAAGAFNILRNSVSAVFGLIRGMLGAVGALGKGLRGFGRTTMQVGAALKSGSGGTITSRYKEKRDQYQQTDQRRADNRAQSQGSRGSTNTSAAQRELSQLEQAAKKVDQALDKIVLRMTQINGEKLDKLDREFESFARQIGQVGTEINQVITKVGQLDRENTNKVSQEFKALTGKANSTQSAIDKVKPAITRVNDAGLGTIKEKFNTLKSAVGNVKTAVGQLITRITNLNGESLKKVQGQFTTLKSRADSAGTAVGTAKSGLNSKIRSINGLSLSAVTKQFTSLKTAIGNAATKAGTLDTNIQKVNRQTGGGAGTTKGKPKKKYATGGILPGYTPGRDVHIAALSGGEAVMRPEWTRAVGSGYIHSMNAAAMKGGVGGVQKALGLPAFKKGGVVGGGGKGSRKWPFSILEELTNILNFVPALDSFGGGIGMAAAGAGIGGETGSNVRSWGARQGGDASGRGAVGNFTGLRGFMFDRLPQFLKAAPTGVGNLIGLAAGAIAPTAGQLFWDDVWKGQGNILSRGVDFTTDLLNPKNLLQMIKDLLGGVWDTIKGLGSLAKDLITDPGKVLSEAIDTFQALFNGVIDNVKSMIDLLGKIIGNPSEFAGEVWDNFYARAQEVMPNTDGLFKFANGGTVPGYAPGKDTVTAMLSRGEAVLKPQVAKALGPDLINAMNSSGGNVDDLLRQLLMALGIAPGASGADAQSGDPKQAVAAPVEALNLLGGAIKGFVSGVATPEWQNLASATQTAWTTGILPVYGQMETELDSGLAGSMRQFTATSSGEWNKTATNVRAAWTGRIRPDWQAMSGYLSGQLTSTEKTFQGTNRAVWNGVQSDVSSSWGKTSSTFGQLKSGVKGVEGQFTSSADAIKREWSKAMSLVDSSTRTTVNGPYNQGAVSMMSAMAKLAGDKAPLSPLHFATGGVVPGYAPGVDRVPAVLSPGEGILRPEVVRQLGASTIHAWNASAKRTGNAFANGGVVGQTGSQWVNKHKDDPYAGYQEAIGKGFKAVIEPNLKAVSDSFKTSGQILAGMFAKTKPQLEAKGKYWDDHTGLATSKSAAQAIAVERSRMESGARAWANLCEMNVETAWGYHGLYPSARVAALATSNRHKATGAIPPGAAVWWPNIGGGYGHVALADSTPGYVWSNDVKRQGAIDRVPISAINDGWGGGTPTWSAAIGSHPLSLASGGGNGNFNPWPGTMLADIADGVIPYKGGGGVHASPAQAKGIAKSMLDSMGWGGHFGTLVEMWNRESGWRWNATNPSSGAYGIPQSLPASKMATTGPDWHDNAATQIGWGLGYIKNRYGDPGKAWDFWKRNHWYANGGLVTKPTVGMIGEAGPELVLPLHRRERTEELLDKAGLSQDKGHTVNVYAAPNVPTEDQIMTKLRHLDMLYG
jgi:tape measure domain-containing protein